MERGRVLGAVVSVLLGAGLIAAGSATAQPTESRPTAGASVINGKPVPIASFPWMAVVEHRGSAGRGQCSGTVVAPRVVLTAGHCVQNLSAGGIRVAAGYRVTTGVADVRQKAGAQVVRVSQALIFPGFEPGVPEGDAGLLILAEPVAAAPLLLAGPADAALYARGTRLTIAGWGVTDPDSQDPSNVLRSGEAIVQSNDRCTRRALETGSGFSEESDLCALSTRAHATSACSGDSGGPAIARRTDGSVVQVGIVSRGHWRCAVRFPQFLTRVDYVSGWVAEWIAAVEAGAPAPAVEIPKVSLPRMSRSDARGYAAEALTEDFGLRFFFGENHRVRCRVVNRESAKCSVSWHRGRLDYFGSITVFYVRFAEGVALDYRYRIHWASDRCRPHRDRRTGCTIHTRIR